MLVSTFTVVLPFRFTRDPEPALRLSNLVAVAMLFLTGFFFGRCAELRPWRTGVAMVIIGVAMVATTMALGG